MSSSAASAITSTSSGPTPSTTPQANNEDKTNVNFYRNLFYILIGLLAAFATIACLSLLRARWRRKKIHAEAERLGLLAPGMPGYISIRDRRAAGLAPGQRRPEIQTTHRPDWWEVGAAGWMNTWIRPTLGSRGYSGGITLPTSSSSFGFSTSKSPYDDDDDENNHLDLYSEKSTFKPLAIIPPQPTELPSSLPLPVSNLKFFPKHLAYRPEDLLPPPLVWGGEDMDNEKRTKQMEGLKGKVVDVVTMIRMPEPETATAERNRNISGDEEEEEDGQEVLREWGGVCLGVVRMGIRPGMELNGRLDGSRRSIGEI